MTQVTGPGYFEHLPSWLGSLNRGINNVAARQYHHEIFHRLVQESLDSWSTKSEVDLFEHVSVLTHKVIVGCLMGPDFLEHNVEELYHLLSEIEKNIGSIWNFILPSWIPHTAAKRLCAARQRVVEIFEERLEARKGDPKQ